MGRISEETEIVKTIFLLYIIGVGTNEICRRMVYKGNKTGAGKSKWTQSPLTSILNNEKYYGDLIQHKNVTLDYLSKKRVKTENLRQSFILRIIMNQ